MASQLALRLQVPRLELDSIRHQADWKELPDDEFALKTEAFVSQDGWVVDGNYFAHVTERVVWPAADTVVWLDLPKSLVMRQVTLRTLKRGILRQELWNGNRERLSNAFRLDPLKSMIVWSWTSYQPVQDRYDQAMSDPKWEHLTFIRLRSQREERQLLEGVTPPSWCHGARGTDTEQ